MTTVNMLEAKTNLSKLVEAVESGAEQEIIIARNGKPVVRLVPLTSARPSVTLGLFADQYGDWSLETSDALDAEIEQMFAQSEIFPPDDDEAAS